MWGERMSDMGQDATFLDLHLTLHTKQFKENFYTRLGWKNLRYKGPNSAESPLQNLHLGAHLDLRADFNRLLTHYRLAQSFDNILPDNGSYSSKLDDVGNAVAGA
jgi:hypothetical protein